MSKKEFGPQPWIFPNPTVLVGTVVGGKPNIAPYAWCGIAGAEPPMLGVGVRHERYTLKGIYENMAFSVNIPSVDIIAETDYCGMTSGAKTDKITTCGFKVFYGKLENAPLIEECPVNLECEVIKEFSIQHRQIFVGEVHMTYVDEEYLMEINDQKVIAEMGKLDPIIYALDNRYYKIGENIGTGYQEGKEFLKE